MPPSETWQDSGAACSLLSTAVCCCPLGGVGRAGFDLAWYSAAFNLCSKHFKMHFETVCYISNPCSRLVVLLALLLFHLELCLSTLTTLLLSPKLEASGDLTTVSLTLAFPERITDKSFGFSSITISKAGCRHVPHASLVSLVSPWSVD